MPPRTRAAGGAIDPNASAATVRAMQLIKRVTRAFRPAEGPPATPVVIAESNGAQLVRLPDGKRTCECPFACLATFESCEFGLYKGVHG